MLDNPASNYHGTGGGGQLRATGGGTLEILDVGAAFPFTGDVIASGGSRVFSHGFALDFLPGSLINLTGATYESDISTDIGGAVTIGVGADSTIEIENNWFLSFEAGATATLNGNLRLLNNNIILEDGVVFSGNGALVVPDGSHLVSQPNADVGVLLLMEGGFRPGNSEGIGRVNLTDFQQADTSELFVEILGTALNAHDRLVVAGDAIVDGFLSVDIDGTFVPALGNTFNILTTSGADRAVRLRRRLGHAGRAGDSRQLPEQRRAASGGEQAELRRRLRRRRGRGRDRPGDLAQCVRPQPAWRRGRRQRLGRRRFSRLAAPAGERAGVGGGGGRA